MPHLLDIEITQVLRRLVQRKELTLSRAEQAFEDLSNIAVERHELPESDAKLPLGNHA